MKTDEDKSLVAERPAGNSRQRRVPCHGRCRGGMGNVRRMPPRMGPAQRAPRLKGYATGRLGGVVCRRESEGFYHGGGGPLALGKDSSAGQGKYVGVAASQQARPESESITGARDFV